MGFSIDTGFGPLGALVITILISAGAIVLVLFFAAVRRARQDVLDETPHDDIGP